MKDDYPKPPIYLPPKDAHYKCCQCGVEWDGKAGPTDCIICGHEYVKWTDYKEG